MIEKLALPAGALEVWADALKRALGCGGGWKATRSSRGDQRERAVRWLEGRGVRKVVRG